MFDKKAFDKMKDGVVLLNFSRDTLVNEEDMKEALASGKVAKYVVDFPNPNTVNMPNTTVTPHLGASNPGVRRQLRQDGSQRDPRLYGER